METTHTHTNLSETPGRTSRRDRPIRFTYLLSLAALLLLPLNTAVAKDDKLTAIDIEVATDENTPVTVDVLTPNADQDDDDDKGRGKGRGKDDDGDDDRGKGRGKKDDKNELALDSFTQPENGEVTENEDGTLTYTPDNDYTGTDSFEYTIREGKEKKKGKGKRGKDDKKDDKHYATATVTVTVNQVSIPNNPPTADDASYEMAEDGTLSGSLTGSDPDGDPLTFALASDASHGAASVNGNGSFTYTPNADYNGSDSFTFTVNDGPETSGAATVSISVTAVNDAPVITSGSSAGAVEDEPFSYTATAIDVDGDAISYNFAGYSSWAAPSGATLSGTPGEGDGDFSFTVTASDGNGGSDLLTVSVTVRATNDTPVAKSQSVTTDEDVAVAITLTSSDDDGDALTYSFTQPANGDLSGAAPNLTYTPDENYNGSDSFTFTVNDGTVNSAAATVSITINAVNDVPVANNDAYTVAEDSDPVVLDVLENDSDADGDALTIQPVKQANGIVHILDDGTLTYKPTPNFSGLDEFIYAITDGYSDPVEATVTVNVTSENDPPVASAASFSVDEDATLSENLTGTDPDGDILTFALAVDPSNGSANVNSNGSFTYSPNADYNGSDSFTFTVNDGSGKTAPATVSLTINAINDAPVITSDDSHSATEDLPFTYVATATDVDGDVVNFSFTGYPASWATPSGATLSGTPGEGDDDFSFTVTADDNNGGVAVLVVSVTVTAVNDAPLAVDDDAETDEDVAIIIPVLDNDSDPDGDPLSVSDVFTPAHGSASANGDGTITYTPAADYNGPDSFLYSISDGNGGSATANVSVTVTPTNDDPIALDDSYTLQEDEDITVPAPGVLANDDDNLDGDTITASLVTDVVNGNLVLSSDGSFTYTPVPDYSGADGFVYAISDGKGGTAQATVNLTVNPVNDIPVAHAASFTMDEDDVLTGVLTAFDADGEPLRFELWAGAESGVTVIENDGSFTYTPNTDYNGPSSFTFRVYDAVSNSQIVKVEITINAINDAPVITSAANASATQDELFTYTATAEDVDVDAVTIAITIADGDDWLTADGVNLSGTPEQGITSGSFTIVASDGLLESAPLTVTVSVNDVNDLPVADGQEVRTGQDQPVAITLTASDLDNDPLTWTILAGPNYGLLSGSAPNLTYTPNSGFSGSDGFTFSVDDGRLGVATADVAIYINVGEIAVSDEVGPDGGTVSWDSDGAGAVASITIPEGALLGNVDIEISFYLDPPDRDELAGPVFFYGPSGLQFDQPVTITVPYDPFGLPAGVNAEDLAVIMYDEAAGTWTDLLPSTVDTDNFTVSAQTLHFTGFAAGVPAGINHAPVAAELPEVSILEDAGDSSYAVLLGDLRDYFSDSDPDDELTFSAEALHDGIDVFISNLQQLIGIPDDDFNGTVQIAITATDGSLSVTVILTLVIEAVNDAPNLVAIADFSWPEDQPVLIPLRAIDVEGDSVTFSAASDTSAVAAVVQDTTLVLVPLANWSGLANISVTATDNLDAAETSQFSVTFESTNDLPTAFALLEPADSTEITISDELMGEMLTFSWETSTDPDGQPVSYAFVLEDEADRYIFRDTTATSASVPYADIVAVMDDLELPGGATFWWSIWALSGSDSVEAINGPFSLTLNRTLAVEDGSHLPQIFALHQNFPNPFNPVTTLRFEMPAHTRVTLTVYDIRGREVTRLVDGYLGAGYNKVVWNSTDQSGRPVPSGIYFARIVTPEYTHTIKMSLIK